MPLAEAATNAHEAIISPMTADGLLHPEQITELPGQLPTTLVSGLVVVANVPVQYTAEIPAEPEYEGVAGLVPGFGGIKPTSKSMRRELSQLGYTTFSYRPVRTDSASLRAFFAPQDIHIATIEAVYDDLSTSGKLQRVIKPLGITTTKRLIIPHSMGGGAADPYAEDHPDEVDGVISLATIGRGSPTWFQLFKDVPRKAIPSLIYEIFPYIQSGEIEPTPANVMQILHYYGVHPGRTVSEMHSCLTLDLRPNAVRLARLGIMQCYLGFEFDCLVPPNERMADYTDRFEVMRRAGHLAPQLKAATVARAVVNLHQGKPIDSGAPDPTSLPTVA